MKNLLSTSFLLLLLLPACNKVEQRKDQSEPTTTESAGLFRTPEEKQSYVAELQSYRAEKNSFLKTSSASPIRRAERSSFNGLKYYDFDVKFVVRATLDRNENPTPMTIPTTTGTNRSAIKYGYLKFSLNGKTHRLGVYKFTDRTDKSAKPSLFVPFTDSTSGHDTYGAGRYLDLEENESGEYIVDFNYAYNPYCAYNEDYSCPIPPRENRLAASIIAGEKLYH